MVWGRNASAVTRKTRFNAQVRSKLEANPRGQSHTGWNPRDRARGTAIVARSTHPDVSPQSLFKSNFIMEVVKYKTKQRKP